MKLLSKTLILLGMFFLNSSHAKAIDLTGVWCGKWDNIFATCFEVVDQGESFDVVYRWEENIDRGFQKKTLSGRRLNANTLDMSGKILVVDLKNQKKALAIGFFENHSRIANMTRLSDSSSHGEN